MTMVKADTQLYEEIVGVTYRYLGVAADRFVSRQCQSHLGKTPDQLRRKDLRGLITWFTLAMGMLSEDPAVVRQFESDLQGLTARKR